MPTRNIFLDTNILIDYIVPARRNMYTCSVELVENVKNGQFSAWIVDYALAEALGFLKEEREKRIGTHQIPRETLSSHEIEIMVGLTDRIRKIPNLNIFAPTSIQQSEIFDKVKTVCVQATDALVLLSLLELAKKIPDITLVTRDERLRVRGGKLVQTMHPISCLNSCPKGCTSSSSCKHKKP